jgi:formylglycine-generating enzyme required for sulfatase activity
MKKNQYAEMIIGLLICFCFIFALQVPKVWAAEKRFINDLGMTFVFIDKGIFLMGSPEDETHRNPDEIQYQVTITTPFYMQTTEVTLKQWWSVMGKRWFGRRKGTPDMPVTRVSWFETMRFIKKLNKTNPGVYRLPTEAEWEYAARAGSSTAYSWGNVIDCSRAMYSNNALKSRACINPTRKKGLPADRPAPVKSYSPNAWGFFDMHGNVWEWCLDWYGRYPSSPSEDPQGLNSGIGRVRRGGSWFKDGFLCRSANRNYAHPAGRLKTTGFRLVWSQTAGPIKVPEEPDPRLMKEPDGP